jgi:hypothetical protein
MPADARAQLKLLTCHLQPSEPSHKRCARFAARGFVIEGWRRSRDVPCSVNWVAGHLQTPHVESRCICRLGNPIFIGLQITIPLRLERHGYERSQLGACSCCSISEEAVLSQCILLQPAALREHILRNALRRLMQKRRAWVITLCNSTPSLGRCRRSLAAPQVLPSGLC